MDDDEEFDEEDELDPYWDQYIYEEEEAIPEEKDDYKIKDIEGKVFHSDLGGDSINELLVKYETNSKLLSEANDPKASKRLKWKSYKEIFKRFFYESVMQWNNTLTHHDF